jgi:hypothetical protein
MIAVVAMSARLAGHCRYCARAIIGSRWRALPDFATARAVAGKVRSGFLAGIVKTL